MNRTPLTKDQLIEEAKKIDDLEERALFIMHYFLDTISYDYAYLLGAGYAQGSLSMITGKKLVYKNPFKKEGDNLPEYLLKYQTDVKTDENGVLQDHSEMVSSITNIETEAAKSGKSNEEFIKMVKEYFKEELSKYIDNPELVEQNVDRLMSFMLDINQLHGKMKINGEETTVGYSMAFALMEIILKKDDIFPPLQLKDGLITKGVCEDYSIQIAPLLQELGIDAYCIGGTSELSHRWIIARINDELKSLDLTRAVFIRDGFRGIPKDQTMDEWLYCSVQHALDMQSTRTIREIDDEKLDKVLDAHNYDENEFNQLLLNYDKRKEKQGTIALTEIKDISPQKPIS